MVAVMLPLVAAQYAAVAAVSPAAWTALNATVHGRLHTAKPFSLPCFSLYENKSVTPDPAGCAAVQAGYASGEYRSARYDAFVNPQWEACMLEQEKCLLNANNVTDPTAYANGANCAQGGVSPYYIAVEEASDVQAAFSFSAAHGVPLSIKNSGHDYAGRSAKKGSLALWMRKLTSLEYNASFVPENCNGSKPVPVITTGAGALFDDVYKFADAQNVTYIGGYAQTVGASGGFVMTGGHSVLSPVYGLAVDRVVQFKLVTPDGVLRVANECTNPDLFWALRGGGGGTFGVVLESSHRVEPRLTLQVAKVSFTSTVDSLSQFYNITISNALKWGREGWGGHISGSGFINLTPLLTLDEAIASVKPVTDFIEAQNGSVVVETLSSWLEFYNKYLVPAVTPVGQEVVLASRLLPISLFETTEGQAKIVDTFTDMVKQGLSPYIPIVPPFLHNATANATSASPAWYTSLWDANCGGFFAYNASIADEEAAYKVGHDCSDQLKALAPDSGSYMNEADIYDSDHQASWWGANYPRLLEIKKKYDPRGLLDCWKCVGWKGEQSKDFQCYLPSSTIT
ncbi:FAD-binding domain-containing protein [Punctularia strigosozonata HHB-11173 SS5]|uniref:FAD-binding domain-containing protein n=1 Tax=Punctularia strigosozonata (strain HHB-11173) TaxID=741275 RepID=UPI000441844E|nr:FAD-binding domain-containing protein [Punctularia strigosozonata HHB-11173 SS5]EIN11189.1 FAD-binding domain-containing protein [Punctularia strigosozonata HHB-11173 SS5]